MTHKAIVIPNRTLSTGPPLMCTGSSSILWNSACFFFRAAYILLVLVDECRGDVWLTGFKLASWYTILGGSDLSMGFTPIGKYG